MSVIASDGLNDPVTGLLVKDGTLYVSHKGKVSWERPTVSCATS